MPATETIIRKLLRAFSFLFFFFFSFSFSSPPFFTSALIATRALKLAQANEQQLTMISRKRKAPTSAFSCYYL